MCKEASVHKIGGTGEKTLNARDKERGVPVGSQPLEGNVCLLWCGERGPVAARKRGQREQWKRGAGPEVVRPRTRARAVVTGSADQGDDLKEPESLTGSRGCAGGANTSLMSHV